ncbi:DNA repair protein RecO [Thiotrichales bacterium 19S3-7]|nr:DNA repair protein RecO [Thiotrichales bacterium 19S3-7]MCF6800810.1 DNA repair protein RecO [Thiotrichales bacterium 19S3-11]
MLVSDIGYVLYKKKYRESSLLITLFTQSYGKINALVKGYYRKNQKQFSLFESGFLLALQMKKPRNEDGLYNIYKSEVYQINTDCRLSYLKQMCCYYINELIYYLYPNAITDDGLFQAYQKSLTDIANASEYDVSLRVFESKLLGVLGYQSVYDTDDQGNKINDYDFYQLQLMMLPQKVNVSQESSHQLILLGSTLRSLSDLEKIQQLEDKYILKLLKIIHKLYINHLLQGRQLESRRLVLEYTQQMKANRQRSS